MRRLMYGLSFATLLLPSTAVVAPRLAPRAEAAPPVRNGRIAFIRSDVEDVSGLRLGGVNFEIFTVLPSGAGLHQVTDTPEIDELFPKWSPDGRRIAFTGFDPIGTASAACDIFVMDPSDPAGATNLTASPLGLEGHPAWSPDGTRIVFASDPEPTFAFCPLQISSAYDIFVMDSDGTDVVQLTDESGSQVSPAWSPQGDVIAYADTDADSIRLIRPDGADAGIVVDVGAPFAPSWSPDGRRIVFGDLESLDIWVVNRDGSGLKNLTGMDAGDEFSPSWSPDGRWIAFVSDREGDYKLFKMRPDGSDVTKVVDITVIAETVGRIDWGRRP